MRIIVVLIAMLLPDLIQAESKSFVTKSGYVKIEYVSPEELDRVINQLREEILRDRIGIPQKNIATPIRSGTVYLKPPCPPSPTVEEARQYCNLRPDCCGP